MKNLKIYLKPMILPSLAILFAFLFGAFLILISGINPFLAYAALFRGAFGSIGAISQVLNRATPLIFTGLAVMMGLKVKSINIGAEGQFIVGGFCAALAGAYIATGVMLIDLLIVIVSGFLGGGLWVVLPAILKIKKEVNTIISTIMMNYIALAVISFFLLNFLMVSDSDLVATQWMEVSARMPLVIPPPGRLGLGFILSLFIVGLLFIFLNKTVIGFEIKAVGSNPIASQVSGISSKFRIVFALILSGALAGMGGAIEVSSVFGRYYDSYSPGYGFAGIPVAILARGNPIAIILTALLFSILRVGSTTMQTSMGVSRTIVDAMQGIIIMFIAAEYIFTLIRKKRQVKLQKPREGK
jgi:simple sugar transport system permease protein